ncbi:unnamed protein product [Thelazia callipaeda]|uniref:Biogenesis of lysosome-related organelles complex 1 subunit 1 n=1 Tax=Thelazia callipaeda TaxID=103827 RepID=A0A0N5D7P0_THECL|nr:unnamed protein product [Thelazia callipaeda]
MEDNLEERIANLEERLGLYKSGVGNINGELNNLRRKLSLAGCGFLLKIPSDLLHRINDLAIGVGFYLYSGKTCFNDYLTTTEKKREIEFGHDIMLKRVELLQKFKRDSEIALNSESIASVCYRLNDLEAVEKEVNDSTAYVREHHMNVADIKRKFVTLLEQLQYQVLEWQSIVEKLERDREEKECAV